MWSEPGKMSCRFISRVLLLAVITLCSAPEPAHAAEPRIGFLSPGTPETSAVVLAGLRQGLREHGYVEGTNIAIVSRFAGLTNSIAFRISRGSSSACRSMCWSHP